jgi:hypothetical protein
MEKPMPRSDSTCLSRRVTVEDFANSRHAVCVSLWRCGCAPDIACHSVPMFAPACHSVAPAPMLAMGPVRHRAGVSTKVGDLIVLCDRLEVSLAVAGETPVAACSKRGSPRPGPAGGSERKAAG